MKSQFKSKQRGISFLGLIVVGVLLAMAGVIGAQVFPTYLEYAAVNKAVNKASLGSTVAEVRSIFDKQTQVDDIKSVTGKDLEVTKDGDKIIVRFAYEREIHLTGPAFLTLKYAGQSK
jgi:sensor histidine kinase regulating citrate/malate metabolism